MTKIIVLVRDYAVADVIRIEALSFGNLSVFV